MNLRRLTSILLSAVLISGAVPSSIKASASFPMPDISYSAKEAELSEIDISPSFAKAASIQEAGSQVRDFMASKTPSFTVSIPRSSVSDPKTAHKYVLAEALKETSKANEGDYIRYGWKKYDCTYSISTSAVTMTFDMQYYTTYQEETAVTNECRRILSSLGTGDMSDYDKIKTIYRYIARNTSYADSISDQHVFTAYGALIDHVAVCQGYSQLFYRMMRESGIDCRIISGTSNNENHAWNIVKLGGIYYLMDVTSFVADDLKDIDMFTNVVEAAKNDEEEVAVATEVVEEATEEAAEDAEEAVEEEVKEEATEEASEEAATEKVETEEIEALGHIEIVDKGTEAKKAKYIYDPSLKQNLKLKKAITGKQQAEISKRHQNGEKLSDIYREMGILK